MYHSKRWIAILAAVCALGLTACAQQAAPAQDASSQPASSQGAAGNPGQGARGAGAPGQSADQNTVYGKVTAVSGSQITYEIGTLNIPQRAPGDSSGASRQPGSRPQGGSRQPGSRPSGSRPSASGFQGGFNGRMGGGNGGGFSGANLANLLTMTGQTATVTISDPGVLQKQETRSASSQPDASSSSGSASGFRGGAQTVQASLSDIKAGDFLRVTTQKNDGKLLSVLILGSASGT